MLKKMSGSEYVPYFPGNETFYYDNDINQNQEASHVGDFTAFYITITICSVLLGFVLILNLVCCCSRYSNYWLDRYTGNRWLVSIWSSTPHKQPPLDFTELENQFQQIYQVHPFQSAEYSMRELEVLPSISQQPLTSSQEYLELHKRESDI